MYRNDRVCKADCTINGLFIPKDMPIVIPILALHMDPEAWPNPTKFDPDRYGKRLFVSYIHATAWPLFKG